MQGFSLFDPENVGAYLGRVERLKPGDRDVTILDVRATDDRGAQVITVNLSVQAGGSPADRPLRAPTAKIDWGVGGGRDSVELDFLQGQLVELTASYVRISASYPLAGEIVYGGGDLGPDVGRTDPNDPGSVLLLGASIGGQSHSKSAFGTTPRLTTWLRLAEGARYSDWIPVPSHAQSVTVLAPGALPLELGAFPVANVEGRGLYFSGIGSPNLDQFAFPIARAIGYVRLTRESALDQPVTVGLLWTIGL
jgi:hypothetical protein